MYDLLQVVSVFQKHVVLQKSMTQIYFSNKQ